MPRKPIAGRRSQAAFTLIGLKKAGFEGFRSVRELLDSHLRRGIPELPGVYVVLHMGDDPPEFLETSSGGWFKGRDPTFEIGDLAARWVSRARVVYIGMTGEGRRAGLRTRIRALVRYGTGHNIGHAGRRALWQVPASGDLLVCWRPTEDGADAALEERRLLNAFSEQYGHLPFANAI